MRSWRVACCALLAALAFVAFADGARTQYRMAPPGPDRLGGPTRFRFRSRPPGYVPTVPELLLNDFLQLELKLSDEQVWRLEDIDFEAQRHPALERQRRPISTNSEAHRALDQKIERETHRAMLEALSPAQRERVRQIEVQLAGPAAYADPAVQEELQLTAAQKEAVESAFGEAWRNYLDEPRRGGRPSPDRAAVAARQKRLQELSGRTLAKLEALLSADQKKRWAALRGEPYRGLAQLEKPSRQTGLSAAFYVLFGPGKGEAIIPALRPAEVAEQLRGDLKITEDQATRITQAPPLVRELQKEVARLRDKQRELQKERAALEARQEAEMAKAMTDVLTPEQRQRLEQIKVQVLGPAAREDPAVQKALKLTDEQKAAISKARDEAQAKLREQWTAPRRTAPPVRSGPLSPKELRLRERQWAAGYRALQDRIVGLLTPEQQKRWRELTGPPVRFRVEIDYFRR